MESMYIGSGDCRALLAGLNTKAHRGLLDRFTSGVKPYYNALGSPINAMRTGAILEGRYALTLPNEYYAQVKIHCEEMVVLCATLDFAKLDSGKIVDFEEVKFINFDDFRELELYWYADNAQELLKYIRKDYKIYYNQVQHQLVCTGLESGVLTFGCVYSYEDEENYIREIQPNEVIKIRIHRDEEVCKNIRFRAIPFQFLYEWYQKSEHEALRFAVLQSNLSDDKDTI